MTKTPISESGRLNLTLILVQCEKNSALDGTIVLMIDVRRSNERWISFGHLGLRFPQIPPACSVVNVRAASGNANVPWPYDPLIAKLSEPMRGAGPAAMLAPRWLPHHCAGPACDQRVSA